MLARIRSEVLVVSPSMPLAVANEPSSPEAQDVAHVMEQVLAALARIEARLDQQARTRPRRSEPCRLLSLRAAAKMLGVDRGTTLRELIDAGHVHTVVVHGKTKVPASEVERIEREGTSRRAPPPRPAQKVTQLPARRPPPRASDVVQRIAALKV